jgi:16S rRNA (guanine527-N7)-methyltransferase
MSVVLAPPRDAVQVTDEASFQRAAGATSAQMADLRAYRDLITEKNAVMNLVGPSALEQFWPRHVWDSAQLLSHAPDALVWADLGAGAGFPGIVLAILLKGREGAMVHLVESMTKRCKFLEDVVVRLALPAQVHDARAEDLSLSVDIVTARACAPATRLLGYARPYLSRGATGLFLKGQDIEAELADAAKVWKFQSETRPSSSSETGRLWIVEGAPRER